MQNGRFLPNAVQKTKGAGDWRDLAVSMTIPPGGAYLGFGVQGTGGPGTVWFDDFSLEKQ